MRDITEDERQDFRGFCQNATDSQLLAIVEKEREFSAEDDYRMACFRIAENQAQNRGIA